MGNLSKKVAGACAPLLLALTSCALSSEDSQGEPTSVATQEVWRSPWSPSEWSQFTVGMSYVPQSNPQGNIAFAWYNDGWVCRSAMLGATYVLPHNVCGGSMYTYTTAPGFAHKDIRAVAVNRGNSRVYAYYINGSGGVYSVGTSSNLSAHTGGSVSVFNRPARPGGGLFSMNELLEADHSPNGQYYFYWKHSGNGKVYRTTSNASGSTVYSNATEVQTGIAQHGDIVGIGFNFFISCDPNFQNCVEHDQIIGYYGDGFFNVSTSSLNLNQP